VVGEEHDINMFATVSRHREIAGRFLSDTIDNYITDHNGQGGRHGAGKWARELVECDICKGKGEVNKRQCEECGGSRKTTKRRVRKRKLEADRGEQFNMKKHSHE
jgi:DnaJ-class molecular chaperone